MAITFDQIMALRAQHMAKRGIKPDPPEQERPPQEGGNKKAAIMRRMQPPAPEGADPRAFLSKLPPQIADLAARYRRI